MPHDKNTEIHKNKAKKHNFACQSNNQNHKNISNVYLNAHEE